MKMFAGALLLASVAYGLPQFNNFGGNAFGRTQFGGNAFGSRFTQPKPVFNTFSSQSASNSFSRQSSGLNGISQFGSNQGITADQRATYLPVMRALLSVMETNRPSPQDINTLMIATRDLNKKVPKGNGLGGFGNFGNFGGFGIEDLESMGLPESGDMVANVEGVPHIRTSFGLFPLSATSLMTDSERQQFLPVVRTFTNVLEKGNANPTEVNTLMSQVRELNNLIPGNIANSISGLLNNNNSFGRQGGFSGFSGFSG